MRTMTMLVMLVLAMTACGSDGGGDDTGTDVDPRAMACSVFRDDHAGYTFDGENCVFAVDDLIWSHPDHLDLPDVPPPPDVPWIISGWDATDPNHPGSASTSVTQVAADTYSTGGMRWAGDGNERGVAIVVEPRDGNPQWCVWKRCL